MSFILFDDSREPNGRSYLFAEPLRIIRADHPHEVENALSEVSAAVAGGLYAAGFLSYELGYVLEPRLAPLLPERRAMPLIWMGVYERPREFTPRQTRAWLQDLAARRGGGYRLGEFRLSLQRAAYEAKFARALDYIARGDIYQLNLTFKVRFQFSGDPAALYLDLRRKQRAPYGGMIQAEGFHILSLSPELFLKVEDRKALSRPMKGTARRGLTPAEDQRLRQWLASDEKSRAENLMIADLMRNDLGRVAETGSVSVPDLFTVEAYKTVLQMTSGIEARLRADADFAVLVKALFAPGSVTGAPKVRAMEIIRKLEDEPRGVYTGAIGMLKPGGNCLFNVAIRTLVLHEGGSGEIGLGSGLVQDSQAGAEYEECLLKMKFLTDPPQEFKLLETLRWERGEGYYLLDRHLERLAASASHLGFACGIEAVRAALAAYAHDLAEPLHRVRVTLGEDGCIEMSDSPLRLEEALCAAFAGKRVDSGNPLLYHKTTLRDFYDRERERLSQELGCQEVLFLNERGEVTEGSFTNVFIGERGKMLTPALSCGLLPGVLREEMLRSGEAREAVLTKQDILNAKAVWLGNSVRGLLRAELADAASMGLGCEVRKASLSGA